MLYALSMGMNINWLRNTTCLDNKHSSHSTVNFWYTYHGVCIRVTVRIAFATVSACLTHEKIKIRPAERRKCNNFVYTKLIKVYPSKLRKYPANVRHWEKVSHNTQN